MEQSWKQAKSVFATALSAPLVWLVLFFLVPLAIVWAYSFGHNEGLTQIAITGTFKNYARAIEPLYLKIFLKSAWVAALTTGLCLVIGFPVALAITFASQKAKTWLLLLIMLPFWTNLLIRTYALIAVLRNEGYINKSLEWLWSLADKVLPLAPFQPLEMMHTNFAVIVGLVYVHLPFMVLPLYSALDRLDKSLLEASLDLGRATCAPCSRWWCPGPAGHRLGRADHLHPGPGGLSDPGPAGRPRQPDDRQRHRAPVQARQRLAPSARPCRSC